MAVKVLVDADAVVALVATSKRPSNSNKEGTTTSSSLQSEDKKKKKKNTSSSGGFPSSAPSVPKAQVEKMIQEASLMTTLQHPNVVHLLGFCISPPCMAVEYCLRGSLYDVLAQARTDPEGPKKLPWVRRLKMAKDTAAGLLHLHSRTPPILHRDIKSPNILVTADFTVKIADMGLSKLAEEAQGASKVSTMGGGANPRWLAPEILNGERPGMESDVFAYGILMWEILTWELPWSEENVWAVSMLHYLILLLFEKSVVLELVLVLVAVHHVFFV
jgi:serine/threonine protein kinase